MPADPEGYTLYGSFDEGEYTFEAFLPVDLSLTKNEWLLRARTEERVVRERRIPLEHESRFGPDIEDVQLLEEATDALVKELT